ncbi:type II toxin-antitoxin system RelB family antitoxin [Methylocaldum gracile subsp. desertum]|jgi:RHH-type rel operon transcriptional repressor/antitoxin RelB|uniref:type II toxin-antitoxin system RelB family antitoxin n=1 Tax=Methylocaldum sp. GT1BW TaxID=3438964 RepID=UPI00197CA3E9|nr:putative DNA-binding protein [Methylocaldum sp. RMAD-M]
MSNTMITIELSPELENQLDTVAKEHGKSKEEWTREVILEYLQDLHDLKEAEQVMTDIKEGREKTTSLEEVMKEHGLEC